MISAATHHSSEIIRFPTLAERTGVLQPGQVLRLRDYYNAVLLPELKDKENGVSTRSLQSDRVALNNWERYTDNPPITDVDEEHLSQFTERFQASGARNTTINKDWRELKAMFAAAVDDGFCDSVPQPKRRRKGRKITSKLLPETRLPQREIVTEEELSRLWIECRKATYPHGGQFSAPQLWRVAFVLFWTYGARTLDFLKHLTWREVQFGDRLLKFTAQKTNKLQGLPLTDTVIEHLRSIKGHSERVFPGFNSPGCWLAKQSRWKRGFNATWRGEICADAGLLSPVQIKHFRQRVVTHYNALHSGLGSWIAGHYMPGVSAQNYDLPSNQIRELIEASPVPSCFREVG